MDKQIYFELVGERNRMTSEYHELVQLATYKAKELEKLDKLIAAQRPQKEGVS